MLAEFILSGDWQALFRQWRLEQQVWQERTTQELKEVNRRYETLFEKYLAIQIVLEDSRVNEAKSRRQNKLDYFY